MPIKPENKGRYPANWKEISHRIRFVRAEGRCEFLDDEGNRCEARHGHPHPITGSIVVLTCAHLDHQPEHSEDHELRAGCQRCHLRYDAEHHRAERARSRDRMRQRILDKAGMIAFELECLTGLRIAR